MSAAVLETDKTTLNCREGRNCHVTFGGEILNVTLTATQISKCFFTVIGHIK